MEIIEPWLPLLAATGVAGLLLPMWHWIHQHCPEGGRGEVGDSVWTKRWLRFPDKRIAAPYCWRPLVPWLAKLCRGNWYAVSYPAALAVVPLIAWYAGAGWAGFAVALMFVGNYHLWPFNVKWPELSENVGHLLFLGCLVALAGDHWSIYPLALMVVMCRESLGAAVAAVALFVNPWALIPIAGGGAIAWFTRRENTDETHPLVEKTYIDTFRRWIVAKGAGVAIYHWTTSIQPLGGVPLVIPFMWEHVDSFGHLALVAAFPLWFFSVPASGASRQHGYMFHLCIPFLVQLPTPWLWLMVMLSWLWPHDWAVYDERGGHENVEPWPGEKGWAEHQRSQWVNRR